MLPFLALVPDDQWTKLAICTRHYGIKAILKLLHSVLPPSMTAALYHELKGLLGRRPKKAFRQDERILLVPNPPALTDTSVLDISLVNKLIEQCREDRYVYNGRSFDKPTGLKFDIHNLPCLRTSNNSDKAILIKDFRNTVMHWPDQTMSQYYFDKLWDFFEDLLNHVGLNCSGLGALKYGGYLMPDQMMKSFGQILKERTNESQRREGKNLSLLHNYILSLQFDKPMCTI